MGCLVEKTDTGVEIEVHVFDTREAAQRFMQLSRLYRFDRHEPWFESYGFDFYNGPVEGERGAIRERDRAWRAAFWIEGDFKVKRASISGAKPTWWGWYRINGMWEKARNGSGLPIAYASTDAALAGAKVCREQASRGKL